MSKDFGRIKIRKIAMSLGPRVIIWSRRTPTGKPAAKQYVQIHSVVHSSSCFLIASLSYGAELGCQTYTFAPLETIPDKISWVWGFEIAR